MVKCANWDGGGDVAFTIPDQVECIYSMFRVLIIFLQFEGLFSQNTLQIVDVEEKKRSRSPSFITRVD